MKIEWEGVTDRTRFGGETDRISGFDSLLTVLSNGISSFVCNKSAMGGGGLAEGHRQRAVGKIANTAKIAGIAKVERAVTTTDQRIGTGKGAKVRHLGGRTIE
jgi:hypothetical protein